MENNFWEILLSDFDVKLLVFGRIIGVFAFTPMLSRNNLPNIVRIGASLMITYIITMTLGITEVDTGGTVGSYVFAVLREFFIGLVIGFIMNLYVYSVQLAGDVMDSQSGLGMAKVFDPATRMQMSIFGTFISFLIYMYFFATNSHFTLLKIFITSYDIIPLEGGTLNPELGWSVAVFFNQMLILVMKLAMPVIAVEMMLHFCMGVLMKAVPQIQIMVINIQLMVVIGFITLFLIAAPLGEFIDKYVADMLQSAENVISQIFIFPDR